MLKAAVDIGNTQGKIAFFEDEKIIAKAFFSNLKTLKSQKKLKIYREQLAELVISNVGSKALEIQVLSYFSKAKIVYFKNIIANTFKHNYKTFETLGLDRIANAIAATRIYPKKAVLIIDCGSCITSSFIDEHAVFQGGSISPGIEIRLKSLHVFTNNLPKAEFRDDELPQLIGDSTENSILSGVIRGAASEVESIINNYCIQYPTLEVVLCGGQAELFARMIKKEIFADPNLTLKGLYYSLHEV